MNAFADVTNLKPFTASALGTPSAPEPGTQREQLEKNVREWVSESFVGQLLKQMRNSPFRSELFDGGRGGEVFNQLFHQHLAQGISHGVAETLVNSIVRRLDATGAYQQQQQATPSERTDATQDATLGRTPNRDEGLVG